jgi:hypothetical protein
MFEKTIPPLILSLLATSLVPCLASADRYWRDRDIRHFHERDIGVWQGGRWYHGMHGGRLGWWWLTAGAWYFYTKPAYPYPNPYVPQTVIIQQAPQPYPVQPVGVPQPYPAQPVAPPQNVQAAVAPPAVPPAPTTPPGYPHDSWYYCNSPAGYYPYVPNCPNGWTPVAINPNH